MDVRRERGQGREAKARGKCVRVEEWMEREGGQAIGAMGTRRMQLDLHHDYQVRFHHDEGTRGEGPREDSQCSRLSATRLIHYDRHEMEDDYSIHDLI